MSFAGSRVCGMVEPCGISNGNQPVRNPEGDVMISTISAQPQWLEAGRKGDEWKDASHDARCLLRLASFEAEPGRLI